MLYIRVFAAIVLATFSWEAIAAQPATEIRGTTSPFTKEESQIPQTPSAPPSLLQRAPEEYFRCERKYVYQGKVLDCDSNVSRDGEKLRPVFNETPTALNELNTYQRNRRNMRTAAYLTTIGVAVVLAGYAISRPPFESTGNGFTDTHINTGGFFVISGLALSVGSFAYAFSLSKTNDQHLKSAVENFNQVHPDKPIELQFKTGISF